MAGTASNETIIRALKSNNNGCNIAILGTCDTKLEELLLLRQYALDAGAGAVSIIDVGRLPINHEHITVEQNVVAHYGDDSGTPNVDLTTLPRGDVIQHMSHSATKLIRDLYSIAGIHAVMSAGGSGGTSLAAAVMREALPITFPKLLVSTVASGDTGPLVGESDITMMYSVVDISGTNSLLKAIFSNAAGAIVGMAQSYRRSHALVSNPSTTSKKRVGVTMFGVTTPCVDVCRKYLENQGGHEVFVFHATGHGGKAMERLVESGQLDAVLDITTTEICDLLMEGNMSAGPHRLEAAAKAGIPYIVSVGATSMVNFGPRATVPQKYSERMFYEHNPTVTLMRTSKDECKRIGEAIANKLKIFSTNQSNVKVVMPVGGVCMISKPGAPFADSNADEALFTTIEESLGDTGIEVCRDERDINDEGFATDISKRLVQLMTANST